MAKQYQNVSAFNRTLAIKISPYFAYSYTVKPGYNKVLNDNEVRALVNFSPVGWNISDVVDAVPDTPAEIIAIMGPLANSNPLNHTRYTDAEAVLAMGAKANANPLNHDRYTDTEAVAAMGVLGNANPLNHNRYADAEALAAVMAALFVSTEQTGTGIAQNVAHGLAVTPTKVIIAVTDDTAVYGVSGYSVVEGAHDGTNVVVTVTTGVKFKVMAM